MQNAVLYFGIMSDADVIIIGAGMAGLTCGCLLAEKGLKVLMIEKPPLRRMDFPSTSQCNHWVNVKKAAGCGEF
jgi:thioredoxin reductase